MTTTPNRFVVVGVGGMWLTPRLLAFYAGHHVPSARIVIVDGKTYKPRHADHECFDSLGNKARVQAEWLRREFPQLSFEAVKAFIGPERTDDTEPIAAVIREGDVVFLQVDNDRTKHFVDAHCQGLEDIALISGGTDDEVLRVQVLLRRGGRNVTPALSAYCPEILTPRDELPKLPCPGLHEESDPNATVVQHPFTLMTASVFMLNALHQVCLYDAGRLAVFNHDRWHDIRTGQVRIERTVAKDFPLPPVYPTGREEPAGRMTWSR